MKCLHCILELIQTVTIAKGHVIDTSNARNAVTIVCGDACCEVHLAQAVITYAKR